MDIVDIVDDAEILRNKINEAYGRFDMKNTLMLIKEYQRKKYPKTIDHVVFKIIFFNQINDYHSLFQLFSEIVMFHSEYLDLNIDFNFYFDKLIDQERYLIPIHRIFLMIPDQYWSFGLHLFAHNFYFTQTNDDLAHKVGFPNWYLPAAKHAKILIDNKWNVSLDKIDYIVCRYCYYLQYCGGRSQEIIEICDTYLAKNINSNYRRELHIIKIDTYRIDDTLERISETLISCEAALADDPTNYNVYLILVDHYEDCYIYNLVILNYVKYFEVFFNIHSIISKENQSEDDRVDYGLKRSCEVVFFNFLHLLIRLGRYIHAHDIMKRYSSKIKKLLELRYDDLDEKEQEYLNCLYFYLWVIDYFLQIKLTKQSRNISIVNLFTDELLAQSKKYITAMMSANNIEKDFSDVIYYCLYQNGYYQEIIEISTEEPFYSSFYYNYLAKIALKKQGMDSDVSTKQIFEHFNFDRNFTFETQEILTVTLPSKKDVHIDVTLNYLRILIKILFKMNYWKKSLYWITLYKSKYPESSFGNIALAYICKILQFSEKMIGFERRVRFIQNSSENSTIESRFFMEIAYEDELFT